MSWRWSVCCTAEVVWEPRFLWQRSSAHLHFLVSSFSFSSWQYPIDSLWGSGLVSLLVSQAHQHHGHLTNFWCFWQWPRELNALQIERAATSSIWPHTHCKCSQHNQKKKRAANKIYLFVLWAFSPTVVKMMKFFSWFAGAFSICMCFLKLQRVELSRHRTFGSVCRCYYILLENEISIFKKLVSRRKHEVLQNVLVNGCSDVGFQKTQWTNTSRWHHPDSRTLVSKWNAKLALIWKEDFGPLGNSPVLLFLSPGKTPLTTTVAKFLDTSVCGGSCCLEPNLSPFLVKFTQILESILLDNPQKAAVLSVGCASFSVNMLGYSTLWTASFFGNECLWFTLLVKIVFWTTVRSAVFPMIV